MEPIPYGKQLIDKEDIDQLIKTLNSDFLTQGPKVKEFEQEFANYVGAKYGVCVSNATAGLHIGAKALGLQPKDRVITTPITFAATANCIRYSGAEVWFADIDRETYLIDIQKTKELLESKPKGFFKGIIVVDFAGLPVQMDQFRELADQYGLWLIEDACHAPGAKFLDKDNQFIKSGSCQYNDLSVFSFHPVKHIATGEGGMVTTNNKTIYDKLLSLRSHGISKNQLLTQEHGGWYYQMNELGYNYRLSDIQCSLGLTQLRKNDKRVLKRHQIAQKYIKAFKGKIPFQYTPKGTYHAYHLFVIEVDNRKGLYDYLRAKKVFTQVHYIPIHTLNYYQKIGYHSADLSNSMFYYDHCLSLPMFPSLTDQQQDYVIDHVLKYIAK